jgi:hypothetical protein
MMDEKILGRRMKRKRQFGFNPDDDETIICSRRANVRLLRVPLSLEEDVA